LIFDNGIGMDNEGIAKLKRIAYSEKKAGEEAATKALADWPASLSPTS